MSNEQKLREALQDITDDYAERFDLDDPSTNPGIKIVIQQARQALATTEPVMANGLTEAETDATASVMGLATTEPEPEPTGMPELPPISTWTTPIGKIKAYTADNVQTYGEQCWKVGYKHGAWGDKPEPTSKQTLQVEPAVNQQLTTEPFDEREAFEKWAMRNRFDVGHKGEDGSYLGRATSIAWTAWQARAAMTQGVKG